MKVESEFPMNRNWIAVSAVVMMLASGCQCCPLFNCYANFVDDVNDTHLYFDRLYNPRYDVTRMGKPDWCGPLNSHFCPCSCENGCYDRYDECYLYPPSYPYELPSNVMPAPTYRSTRLPPVIEEEEQLPSLRKNKTPTAPPATIPTPAPMPQTN
jgi:hypothetical protein